MRWDLLAARLQGAFTVERLRARDGRILTPASGEPLDLQELLLEAAEEGEEDDELGDLLAALKGPEGAPEALELLERRWATEVVMPFEWEGFGPISSSAQLRLLDVGDGQAYVLPVVEEAPLRTIAAIQPGKAPRACAAFFRSLLQDNGNSYGIDLFGSLPSQTVNHRPDLVPTSAVLQGYWEWMRWAVEHIGPEVWTDLRDSVIDELVEPDPLQRSLRLLRQVPLHDPDALGAWLEAQEREGTELSEEDRLRIFQGYFSRSYVEHRPRRRSPKAGRRSREDPHR
ncbi:MAG: hypothetical protein QN129_13535 [Armatimonadota bacterium]|nr:hypothetical protein [Armatimonadota bacterium]MDR7452754.1 hypothetical protein [Armatimonadota bacterium]MDR7505910.1 hypothetical protein [Armatimonadota bacterium]